METVCNIISADQLIRENITFAKKLARRFYSKRAHAHIDLSDLESAAYVGLCEAANRFDQTKENKFQTYSYLRIIGAMYDYLVSSGGFSRTHYKRLEGKIEKRKYPTMRVAKDLAELSRLKSIIEDWGIKVEINLRKGSIDLIYSDELSVEERLEEEQRREKLKKGLLKLDEETRQIMYARYFEGRTVTEIASEFQAKSCSYISRACTQGIEILREFVVEDSTVKEAR